MLYVTYALYLTYVIMAPQHIAFLLIYDKKKYIIYYLRLSLYIIQRNISFIIYVSPFI